jgi:hypothetical protein
MEGKESFVLDHLMHDHGDVWGDLAVQVEVKNSLYCIVNNDLYSFLYLNRSRLCTNGWWMRLKNDF